MYQRFGQSMPHLSTPNDITTVNYTLSWPYLENPSNTTFVGSTQIDVCRCPRSDLPQQDEQEPGHIYTRYKCVGPEVRFNTPEEDLWVLQAPHGPINMLRPATREEVERREQIHGEAEPTAYAGRNFLFLTGPCPRGRYQAYATLQFLKALNPAARQHVSRLSLLVQPYEEDCSDQSSRQAYADLAEYIVQHLPGFQTLCLNVWDDEMRVKSTAREFSILFHKEGVKISVGWGLCRGGVKVYSSARAFLGAITRGAETLGGRRFGHSEVEEGLVWVGIKEDEDGGDKSEGGEEEDTKGEDADEEEDEFQGETTHERSQHEDFEYEGSATKQAEIQIATDSRFSSRDISILHDPENEDDTWEVITEKEAETESDTRD